MTNLNELIETANRLSNRLEQAANEEKRFCVDIQLMLERMSWQMLCTANDLKDIRDYN